MIRRTLAAALLALVAALGAGRQPVAVMPTRPRILIPSSPVLRPHRGASRDRTLPGKARRHARRTA